MLAPTIFMDNVLPWEKPRIKRILEIFTGSRVLNVKKISKQVVREVKSNEEIQR